MSSNRVLTVDVEAVGLIADIRPGHPEDIHIIHCKDLETGELFTFFDDYEKRINKVWLNEFEQGFKYGTVVDGLEFIRRCRVLIMQNISGYDALALEKAFQRNRFQRNHFQRINDPVFPFSTADTLVMSQLLNPERKVPPQAWAAGETKIGPHSIAAHGYRMGRLKPGHEDWTHLSEAMIHRVTEDVEIGEDMFKCLMEEWQEHLEGPQHKSKMDISHAYYCELRMGFAVARQAQRGFAVDVKYIDGLVAELDEQIDATEKAFRPHMPLRFKMKKLTESAIDTNASMVQACDNTGEGRLSAVADYENYMLNGDMRASYAATNWKPCKKNGEYGKTTTKYIPRARGFKQDYTNPPCHGPFTPLVWEEIPLGNRDAVKQILYKHGWIGVNYNDAELEYIEEHGDIPKPWAGKIDDASLERWEESSLSDVPEWAKGIAAWYVLSSRRTQLLNKKDTEHYRATGSWPKQASGRNECRGILPKARCFDEDPQWLGATAQSYFEVLGEWPTVGHWRVPAEAFACATNTFRMRHKVVVNIPSRGLYGKQMRRCFIAGPGKKLLGCDGAGLELRMLAHFMADAVYTDVVLNGDIHTFNMDMAALPDRDMAKKFIYMFLYGSGIPNLARQIGMSEHNMAKCVAKFKENLPNLDALIDGVQSTASDYGYLLAADGRWGRIRWKNRKLALNTALNVLLQMTGSLVMKWAHIFAEDACADLGIIPCIEDMPIVAHQHDEGQFEVGEDEVGKYYYFCTEGD